MKLVLFTDLHGSESSLARVIEKARVADVVVFAGDLNSYATDSTKLMRALASTKKPCFIVHGNHDSPEELREICEKFSPPLLFIHKGVFEHDGVVFVGHGGGGFSRVDRDFEKLWKEHLRKELKGVEKSVFITHAPPYGTTVDSLYGESRGNESYRNFLEEHQPVLHVCGHFHENFGKKDMVKETTVINPGPDGMLFEI